MSCGENPASAAEAVTSCGENPASANMPLRLLLATHACQHTILGFNTFRLAMHTQIGQEK